jgi:hypothetical protein
MRHAKAATIIMFFAFIVFDDVVSLFFGEVAFVQDSLTIAATGSMHLIERLWILAGDVGEPEKLSKEF